MKMPTPNHLQQLRFFRQYCAGEWTVKICALASWRNSTTNFSICCFFFLCAFLPCLHVKHMRHTCVWWIACGTVRDGSRACVRFVVFVSRSHYLVRYRSNSTFHAAYGLFAQRLRPINSHRWKRAPLLLWSGKISVFHCVLLHSLFAIDDISFTFVLIVVTHMHAHSTRIRIQQRICYLRIRFVFPHILTVL